MEDKRINREKALISVAEYWQLFMNRDKKTIRDFLSAWASAEAYYMPRYDRLIDHYEYALMDTTLSTAISNRKNKVLGEAFLVVGEDGEINEDLTNVLKRQKWFRQVVNNILDSSYFGYTVLEIIPTLNELYEVEKITSFPRRLYVPDTNEALFHPFDPSGIKLSDPKYKNYYIPVIETENYLGLLLKAVPMTIFGRDNIINFGGYNRKYGEPSTIVYTDEVNESRRKIEEMVTRIQESLTGVLNTTDRLEQKFPTGQGGATNYTALYEIAKEELTKLVLGHTKVIEDNKSATTYVNREGLNKTPSEERRENDMDLVETVFNNELIPRLRKINPVAYGFKDTDRFMFLDTYIREQSRFKTVVDPNMLSVLLNHYEIAEDEILSLTGVQVKKKELPKPEPIALPPVKKDPENPEGEDEKAVKEEAEKVQNILNKVKELYGENPEKKKIELTDVQANLFTDLAKKFSAAAKSLAKKIWNNGPQSFSNSIFKLSSQTLFQVFLVNTESLANADLIPYRANIYYFSAAKTWQQVRLFNSFLINPDTLQVRPFKEFEEMVMAASETYNSAWLKAEHLLAETTAQTVESWVSIVREDDLNEVFIEYSAVKDTRTTDICSGYHKMVLPASDPFWQYGTPPNHWNCRSIIKRVYDKEVSKTPEEKPAEFFQNNPVYTKTVYSESHPYFDNIPSNIKEELKNKK